MELRIQNKSRFWSSHQHCQQLISSDNNRFQDNSISFHTTEQELMRFQYSANMHTLWSELIDSNTEVHSIFRDELTDLEEKWTETEVEPFCRDSWQFLGFPENLGIFASGHMQAIDRGWYRNRVHLRQKDPIIAPACQFAESELVCPQWYPLSIDLFVLLVSEIEFVWSQDMKW